MKGTVQSMLYFVFNVKAEMQCAYKSLHVVKCTDLKRMFMSIDKCLEMIFIFGLVSLKHFTI